MDLLKQSALGEFLHRWGLGGLAAGFVSGGWTGRRLSELTAEDLADLGVPRAVRGEILAALRTAVAEELAATLSGWMMPVAHAASGYLREEHPRLRLWSACDVAEMALRLVVIIGLAQVRRAHDGRLPRERLARVFEHIRTPTLSHWRAMALETCTALEEDGTAECRGLGALLAPVARLLSDLVGHGGDTETASLLRLRNMLAHGSVSTSLARDLAERWRARIDDALGRLEPLARLPLLARTADGQVLRVSGEAGTLEIVADIDPAAVGTRAGAAAIGLADRVLPLAPFVLRGVPRVGEVRGSREVPQIFLRRGEIVLEYMALGAEDAAFSQGDDEHLQDFERLFETPRAASEQRFQIPGFERELRRDADQFLGRAGDLKALWTCATGPEPAGLYWFYGPPGIGKSILMARLMADLIDEEERRARGSDEPWLVLAYRFRTGHESCRASTFLGFLRERLSEVVSDPETGTAIRGLDDLQAVLKLLPLAARQARVLVPLDGLDEIAAAEPDFLSLDLASLVGAGGLWLCAGRAEGRLPEFMRRQGAREVLPGGLGGMETAAIRAMILEKAGPLGLKLMAGDRDGGDGQSVVNAFVEAVARKAEGLPLYVRYVIGDILGNRLRFLDGREAEGLPPSLTAYYEELVQRCAVGDDHVLATYALCLLALAYETLSEAAIADLLGRRLTLDGDADAQRARVRAALGRLGGMLTRGFTPEGEIGFRIYHESLREHLQHTPDLAVTRRDIIDNILCKGAQDPGKGAAAKYLYRNGIRHVLDARQTTAQELLLSLRYLLSRLRALREYEPTSSREVLIDWNCANEIPVGRDVESYAAWIDFWELLEPSLRAADQSCPGYMIVCSCAWEHGHNSPITKALQSVEAELIEDWQTVFKKMNRSAQWEEHSLQSVSLGHADRVTELSDGKFVTVHHVKYGDIKLYYRNGHLAADIGRSRPISADMDDAIQLSDGKIVSWSDEQGDLKTSPIFVWDADGQFLSMLDGHTEGTRGVIELTNANLLSWGTDGTLKIWSLKGEIPKILTGHQGSVIGAIQLQDTTILSWAYDGTLRCWTASGRRHRVIELTSICIENCCVIQNRYVIGIFDDTPQAFLTDLETGETAYLGLGTRFHAVIGTDGGLAVLATEDGDVVVWNCGDKNHVISHRHECTWPGLSRGPGGSVLSWSKAGAIVQIDGFSGTCDLLRDTRLPLTGATTLNDRAILYWTEEALHIFLIEQQESQSSSFAKTADVYVCRNEKQIVVLGSEAQLVPVRAIGHIPPRPHGAPIVGAVALVGSTFLTWSGKDPIKLWSDDGKLVEALDESLGASVLGTVEGRPVFGRSDGGATLWDPYGGHHVRFSAGGYSISKVIRLNNGVIAGVCSPSGQLFDGSHVITWKADGTLVAMWAVGEHLVDITGYYDDRILSWSPDTYVQLWDVNGLRLRGFPHEQRHGRYAHTDDYVMNVFVLQNGSILARSRDGILDVWTEKGNLCWSKDLHARFIGYYSDERMYVSVGWRDDIKILDLNGEIVATLPLPSSSGTDTDSLFRCHVMEDGEMVATFLHGALAAWSDSGTVKWCIKAQESTVFQVLRLANGQLLSLSASGELRLWSREGLPCGDPFRHVRESIKGVIRLDNGGIACWSEAGNVSVFREISNI